MHVCNDSLCVSPHLCHSLCVTVHITHCVCVTHRMYRSHHMYHSLCMCHSPYVSFTSHVSLTVYVSLTVCIIHITCITHCVAQPIDSTLWAPRSVFVRLWHYVYVESSSNTLKALLCGDGKTKITGLIQSHCAIVPSLCSHCVCLCSHCVWLFVSLALLGYLSGSLFLWLSLAHTGSDSPSLALCFSGSLALSSTHWL